MTLPASGPLSLSNIQTEFGDSNPILISEYYAGGAYVPAGTSGTYGAVPSSGAISVQNFYGTTAFVPYADAVYITVGTFSFVVPAGITKISAVAVGGAGSVRGRNGGPGNGGGALSYTNDIPVTPGESLTVVVGVGGTVADQNGGNSSIARGGETLLLAAGSPAINATATPIWTAEPGRASSGIGAVKYSGGGGGLYLTGRPTGWRGGAGGAAGYSGNGGKGGYNITGGGGIQPQAGSGGGGGGGGIGFGTIGTDDWGRGGGGVGIYGQGADGAPGIVITSGNGRGTAGGGGSGGAAGANAGSNMFGGIYGGGAGFDSSSNTSVESGGQGAVRIIWGTGKSYPFNAT